MFESLLSSYPKRVDLWSVYVDMTLKKGDLDSARCVLCWGVEYLRGPPLNVGGIRKGWEGKGEEKGRDKLKGGV